MLGSYTTMPWTTLCEVVEGLECVGFKAAARIDPQRGQIAV